MQTRTHTSDPQAHARLSVAPMMAWTDRHCRYLHRLMSRHTLLYTEMVTAAAVVHGDRDRILTFDAVEHPVALQLGGADPRMLAAAACIGAEYGYDEINLNVGCPSDRVQSGCFGAVLMTDPPLVARCVSAMIDACSAQVTVKCRIGVDNQVPETALPRFLECIATAGVRRVIIHARKAWLRGLSAKENRTIPPLDHGLVYQMKRDFPNLHLSMNGGIGSLAEAQNHLNAGMDGVMIGRAAYHTPFDILSHADQTIFGQPAPFDTPEHVVHAMLPYIEAHVAKGGRLHHITRHMLGLFAGRPGARAWKHQLSRGAHQNNAGAAVVEAALENATRHAA